MDESTQKLLEKARERREMLAQKCGIKPLSESNANIPQIEDVNLKNKENASPSKMSLRERLFALQENMNNFDSSMPHKLPEKEKNLNQEKAASPAKPPRHQLQTTSLANSSPSKNSPQKITKNSSTVNALTSKSVIDTTPASPTKVGNVKMTIQERMNALQENFKQDSSTAAADMIRKQRDQEMVVIRNRWKNGMLSHDQNKPEASSICQKQPINELPPSKTTETEVTKESSQELAIPLPPPLPPVNVTPASGNMKTPQKVEKFKKREEARDKLRDDFEQKLLAIGFEVESTVKGERIASIDLDGSIPNLTTSKTPVQFSGAMTGISPKKNWNPLENKAPTPFKKSDLCTSNKTGFTSSPSKTTQQQPTGQQPIAHFSPSKKVLSPAKMECKTSVLSPTRKLSAKLSPMKNNILPNKPYLPENNRMPSSPSKSSAIKPNVLQTPNNVCNKPGSSIYKMVQKQVSVKADDDCENIPSSANIIARAKPAPASSKLNDTFDDSSDYSDTEYDEKEANVITPNSKFDNDMEAAESVLSAEQSDTEEPTECNSSSEISTSGESTDGIYVNMEESYEDGDDERDADEVNNLLNEVLDDDNTLPSERDDPVIYSVVKRPKERVMPPERPLSENTKPLLNKGLLKRQSPSQHDEVATKRVTWHCSNASASTSDSDVESRPIVYTLDDYRAMTSNKGATPKAERVIVVRTPETRQQTNSHTFADQQSKVKISETMIKQRLLELQELVNQQQSIIMQTSNALNVCSGSFTGSIEQIECHRLLLMACKRRQAYIEEMTKLRNGTSSLLFVRDTCPRGTLSISNIQLPLKNDYLAKIGDNSCHIICLIRYGPRLIFTQMLSHTDVIRGCLEVPNLVRLDDIEPDFSVTIEIYELLTTPDMSSQQTLQKKKLSLTPKKKSGLTPKKSKASALQSPGGPMAVRLSNFVEVGSLTFGMKSLSKTHFSLDRVPFSSVLQGTVHINLSCMMESAVECNGFLTMFEDVSGFGAWHRRWFSLRNNYLRYWKYPDDETSKQEPIGVLDLKQCITDVVGLVSRDVCARPNTFELVMVRQQQRGERDTLVTKCYNTVTTIRNMLSADTREDRELWCSKLTEALSSVRMWNSDALRPVRHADLVNAAHQQK